MCVARQDGGEGQSVRARLTWGLLDGRVVSGRLFG